MTHRVVLRMIMLLVAGIAVVPSPACAYLGPGTGLSTLGLLLALLATIVMAIVGFLWYPFKRLWRKRQKAKTTEV